MQRRKRRRRALLARTLFITIIVLIITGAVCLIKHFKNAKETSAQVEPKIVENPPDYEVDLLDINDYSRPGLTLEKSEWHCYSLYRKSGNYSKTKPELF